MENDKMIGLRIQNRRNELKLSFNHVCEMAGISKGNLSGIENSKYLPSAKALIELSKVLNCSIDWILTGKETTPEIISVPISEHFEEPEIDGMLINEREISLIKNYRKLSSSNKLAVEDFFKYKLYDQVHSQELSSASKNGKERMEENDITA